MPKPHLKELPLANHGASSYKHKLVEISLVVISCIQGEHKVLERLYNF